MELLIGIAVGASIVGILWNLADCGLSKEAYLDIIAMQGRQIEAYREEERARWKRTTDRMTMSNVREVLGEADEENTDNKGGV